MDDALTHDLELFDAALHTLEESLENLPALQATLFDEAGEWRKLLKFKLLPQLAGKDVLVAAVAGGTNTGKSTIFNLLAGAELSPVRATAAATCRPLLVGNQHRFDQGVAGNLVPGLQARLQAHDTDPIDRDAPPDTLFMKACDGLPDHIVLLDVPDVDSIDLINWDVAENIQAVCDVLVAVLTSEKYQDDQVIAYFQQAASSGRVILPLMNKSNSADGYAVARAQLDDFCDAVGIDERAYFAVPHDYSLMETCDHEIESLTESVGLRPYLEQMDVVDTKERVYRDTLKHFTSHSRDFVEGLEQQARRFQSVEEMFSNRATEIAKTYDPEPDAQVGKMLHGFIKERRGAVSRTVGNVGTAVYERIVPVGQALGRMVRSRLSLTATAKPPTEQEVREHHTRELEIRTRDYLRACVELAQNLEQPSRDMLAHRFEELDVAAVVAAVDKATLVEDNVSEAFREHAEKTLATWWDDSKMRRVFLVQLDAMLMLAPTAVAVPLAVYSGGIGVPEVIAATSPLAGEFFARVMEHQFADKWLDLIAPWHEEQQARFSDALHKHVLSAALQPLSDGQNALAGDAAETLRRIHEQCLKVS
jgi:hypothetical protein